MTRYLTGPDPNDARDTRVPLVLGITIALFSVSFVVWLLRMYTRCRPVRRLSWDDLFISVAMVRAIRRLQEHLPNV
jgi:hypothetical protein